MPVQFEIKIPPEKLAELKLVTAGIKNGMPKALARAINDTLTGARTDMTQQVYDTYVLNKAYIRNRVDIKYASVGSITGNLYGSAKMSGTALKLKDWNAEQISTGGVRAKIKRGASWTIWKHAFFATMPNGHTGFFERQYRAAYATSRTIYGGRQANKLPWKMWYPKRMDPHRHLTELYGPALESAFSVRQYPTAMPTLENKIQARMDKNIKYSIDFEWSKW